MGRRHIGVVAKATKCAVTGGHSSTVVWDLGVCRHENLVAHLHSGNANAILNGEMTAYSTLLDLLGRFGAIDIAIRRTDDACVACVVAVVGDKPFIFLERTYRDGICYIEDPTPEEMAVASEGDLWQLWNSNRANRLTGVI